MKANPLSRRKEVEELMSRSVHEAQTAIYKIHRGIIRGKYMEQGGSEPWSCTARGLRGVGAEVTELLQERLDRLLLVT